METNCTEDYSSLGYDGINNGATFANSSFGCFFVNSENDYISLPDRSEYSFGTNSYTVNTWIYSASMSPAARRTIFGSGTVTSNTDTIIFARSSSNRWDISKYTANQYTTDSRSANTWYMVTFMRNSSIIQVFVNGVQVNSNWDYTENFNPVGFSIGGNITTNRWDGYIKSVGIWDRVLTSGEINTLYTNGRDYNFIVTDTCTCAGLNTNWEINNSDSCIINDNCNLGTGNITFVGTGTTICNATINTTNLGDPGNGGILNITNNCIINIG